jgi:hypothetical protein
MQIDPSKVALFIPPGLKKFKLALFERIGTKIQAAGGKIIRGDYAAIGRLPDEIIPIVGCTPQFREFIIDWQRRGRKWIHWDRGYLRRVFATGLPRGADGGYYRWGINAFQMRRIEDVPDDRWRALVPGNAVDPRPLELKPWHQGEHILIAPAGGTDYANLHGTQNWLNETIVRLKQLTDRRLIVRDKESKVPLADELANAHALVTHGSIAAVEAVIMGCPVFVDECSAARMMGHTDLALIEEPIYPDRERWCWSLAYHQFCESELVDGTLWRLIR